MPEKIKGTWLRSRSSLMPSLIALFYCLAAYFGGAALILSLKPLLMAAGVLSMGHGMVIAAYLVHDCGHQSLFRSPLHNAALGGALNWLTGGCYATYEDVRRMHMRHHVDNADVTGFDHRRYLARHPVQLAVVEALEWLYIPAVEILMHTVVVLRPFVSVVSVSRVFREKRQKKEKRSQRARAAKVILIRFGLLVALLWYSPIAFACYLAAYALFLTVLRFMDALQHNYESPALVGEGEASAPRRGDRDYEQSHTFSNPVSLKYPWLNLLMLNFGYHNAHHARPTTPWHELPGLHAALHGKDAGSVIPFGRQLASFHRNRVARVLGDDAETRGKVYATRLREGAAVGASGVSFLTPF